MRCYPELFLGALLCGVAGSALSPGGPGRAAAAEAPYEHGWDRKADRQAQAVGVASCASTSCHNFNGPVGQQRSEYSTWAAKDPHAKAAAVLYNDRSKRIVTNMAEAGLKINLDPMREPLCLRCHSTFSGDSLESQRTGDRFQYNDGVGCEACHGHAERWLTAHYEAGFKGQSQEYKASLGLRPTKDLGYRARMCAECHVGVDLEQQVSHDLMAGGHPRLTFELAGYQAIYPRHWSYADERARYSDFEARMWALGQVATARSAVDLLRQRAEAAEGKKAPWPEFAEYDCYSCHRDITTGSPTQKARWSVQSEFKHPERPTRPGAFPYGTWNLNLLLIYGGDQALAGRQGGRAVGQLRDLRKLMQEPQPDAARVRDQARKATDALDAWLREVEQAPPMEAARVKALVLKVLDVEIERARALEWDEAAQTYLAVAALEDGLMTLTRQSESRRLVDDLRAYSLRLQAAFPKGTDTPRLFDPLAEKPRTLRQQLEAIRDQLRN